MPFRVSGAMTLHMRMRSGRNVHHILEASFKVRGESAPRRGKTGGRRRAVDKRRTWLATNLEAIYRRRRLRHR